MVRPKGEIVGPVEPWNQTTPEISSDAMWNKQSHWAYEIYLANAALERLVIELLQDAVAYGNERPAFSRYASHST
jgi:hypothetical protein